MVKYYYNVNDGFIDKFNGVKGAIGTSVDLNFGEYDWIELSESQVERYEEGSNDLKYIFTSIVTPEPEPTLEEKKATKFGKLMANFLSLQAIKSGFTFEGKVFNFDENTINNVIQQKVEAISRVSANEFQLHTRANECIKFTRLKFDSFVAGYSEIIAPLKRQLSKKQKEIEISQNDTELESVNIEFE